MLQLTFCLNVNRTLKMCYVYLHYEGHMECLQHAVKLVAIWNNTLESMTWLNHRGDTYSGGGNIQS